MFDYFLDAIIDTVKLIPFLLITYLAMEYLEDRIAGKNLERLKRAGKVGPIWGSLLGVVPQCGFSASASNLYAGRIISMGTLVAIYLSTSDEMLPILISRAIPLPEIITILATKVCIGIVVGFVVDLVYLRLKSADSIEGDIHHFCEHEHCECHHGIVRPAVVHTLKIAGFVLIITAIINVLVGSFGLDALESSVISHPIAGVFIAVLIGLIPNCGASVAIATLYADACLPFGTMIGGLLTGAGIGLLVLLRVNDRIRENIVIIAILLSTGVIGGILINMLMMTL